MKRRLAVSRTRVRCVLLTIGFALGAPGVAQGRAAVDTVVTQSADLVAAASHSPCRRAPPRQHNGTMARQPSTVVRVGVPGEAPLHMILGG